MCTTWKRDSFTRSKAIVLVKETANKKGDSPVLGILLLTSERYVLNI